jgi:secondary thiamine-phosphate synthase enzyme
MRIATHSIEVATWGHTDIHDLTARVQSLLEREAFSEGQALLFVPGSTAGLTTIEYEPGLLKDLPEMFERIAPEQADYHHHQTWGDRNGSGHLRAALTGPSLIAPFLDGRLCLGTWQQIVLIDFDERPRSRTVYCQLTGQ